MSKDRRRRIAACLSALLPGLGQFYNHHWGKGAGFLIATLVLDAGLNVTSDTITVVENIFQTSAVPVDVGGFILRMLPLLVIALWSMADAARSRPQENWRL